MAMNRMKQQSESESFVVQGSDGRLYRVIRSQPEEKTQNQTTREEEVMPRIINDAKEQTIPMSDKGFKREESLENVGAQASKETRQTIGGDETEETKTIVEDSRNDEIKDQQTPAEVTGDALAATEAQKIRPRSLIGDIEDASDDEGDEFKSIWRNRRPSPGKWIEPIPGF
mmetsp:Transcript_32722/g.50068  ORF Transcript_32722/g.50068 Transcript_32722/m.50068 type:complete len:171 (+) Transcript_32722:20-532(+)